MIRLLVLASLILVPPFATAEEKQRLLFVGNSFTFGAGSPAKFYRPEVVTDLNGNDWGGVPAMVKMFSEQAGLKWEIAHETIPGANLDRHWREKAEVLAQPWDVVCLQGYSVLDSNNPGDPSLLVEMVGKLGKLFAENNEAVDIRLLATWSRADQVYRGDGPWEGTEISRMALDLRKGYDLVAEENQPLVSGVIPVGEAWNRAIAEKVADANPYDGIAFGKVSLWTHDYYHASIYGSYLEALVIFGNLSGLDPRSLGGDERVAVEMGFPSSITKSLQDIVAAELMAQDEGRNLEPIK
jgi:hypothetical protein